MSGKDLMIYILENNLVDKSIYDEFGIPVWLMTVAEAAEKFNVGQETIFTWVIKNMIDYQDINGVLYIFRTSKDPRKKIK